MHFVKRAAALSYESIQYSQVGLVGLASEEVSNAVVRGSENVATDALEAAIGTNPPVALAADGSDAWKALSAAVSVFFQACWQMPDRFAAAPDVWAALAGMTNQLAQPLINGVNQNLAGSWGTLFGVPVIVGPKHANSRDAALLISRGGASSVSSARTLTNVAVRWGRGLEHSLDERKQLDVDDGEIAAATLDIGEVQQVGDEHPRALARRALPAQRVRARRPAAGDGSSGRTGPAGPRPR